MMLVHARRGSVEAALGHACQAFVGQDRPNDMYTSVKDVAELASCGCRAVAIATATGNYPESFISELGFNRPAEIKKR